MGARWNSLDLSQKPAKVQRTPSPAPKEPREPAAAGRSEIINTTPNPLPASQHYIGPYHLQVACGTHYPGRIRIVLTGPTSEELTAALVAALTEFVKP